MFTIKSSENLEIRSGGQWSNAQGLSPLFDEDSKIDSIEFHEYRKEIVVKLQNGCSWLIKAKNDKGIQELGLIDSQKENFEKNKKWSELIDYNFKKILIN